MDFFRRLAQQLRDVWAGMSGARRALFIIVALLLAALIGGAFYYRAQTEWAVLYSNLTPDDAQAIHDKLQSQVNGLVAFVSKAVEGLTPENVTLVDSKGNQLSEPGGPEAGQVASQLDYRRAVETYLAEKAQAILIPALGAGRAVVKVTADI